MGARRASRLREVLRIAAPVSVALLALACGSDPSGGAEIARATAAPAASSSEPAAFAVEVPREATSGTASARPVVDCAAHPSAPGCRAIPRPGAAHVRVSGNAIVVPAPIEFEPRLFDLTPASVEIVKDLAAFLLEHPEIEGIEIGVDSDPLGSGEYNLALTQQRADAVADILHNAGVVPARVKATGFGESRSMPTARVELLVIQRATPR